MRKSLSSVLIYRLLSVVPLLNPLFLRLLEPEVTPGLLAGEAPNAHQFNVMIRLKGDQMEENSEQYHFNSETRPRMHGRVRS